MLIKLKRMSHIWCNIYGRSSSPLVRDVIVRRWSSSSRAGCRKCSSADLSNLSWDAQTVWCADSSYSWVYATQTTRVSRFHRLSL